MTEFDIEVQDRLKIAAKNSSLAVAAQEFLVKSIESKYSYNWYWLGRPIIQYPQDICAMQELVWRLKPDVIVETGIAHGGSLVLSASLLALIDFCEAASSGEVIDPRTPKRHVIGVDIDIRPHNRNAIIEHPLANRITMIEGSSIDPDVISRVRAQIGKAQTVLVCLDSNHTHDHVLAELQLYAPMVSIGSYCIVFDTLIETLPEDAFPDRPWGPGNNAMTAVHDFLSEQSDFVIDREMDVKLQVSAAPNGYLKRVR